MVVGVWILRQRRAQAGLQPSLYQTKNVVVWLFLLCSIFLLVMPWYVVIFSLRGRELTTRMTGYLQKMATGMYRSGMRRKFLFASLQL